MSMDPHDRLLECALEELHGRKEEGADLAPRIREALERGDPAVPASLLEDPPPAASVPARPPLRVRRALRVGAWAAAALLLLSLCAVLWRALTIPPAPRPFAVAAAPVLLLRGPGFTADFGTALEAGDRVVVPLGEEVEFQFQGGDSLVATGGTLFSTGRSAPGEIRLGLLLGSLWIDGPSSDAASLDLDTGFAQLQPAPGAVFGVVVELDPSSLSPKSFTDPNVARELFRTGLDLPRLLTVSVQRGAVEFAQGPRSEILRAGEQRQTWSEDPADRLWTEKGEQEVLGLLGKIGEAGFGGKGPLVSLARELSPDLDKAAGALSELLATRPQYWTAVEEDLTTWVQDPRARPAALRAIVEFLVRDGTADADALGRDLWLQVPEVYAPHHVVHYADRGYFEFQRELSAMLEAWREYGGPPPVFAAAWLCRRGDQEAIDALEGIVAEEEPDPLAIEPMLLAAYALHAIDDQEPWQSCLDLVEKQVEAYLEAGDPMAAAGLVLLLQHLDDARQREEPAPLGTLPRDLDRLVRAEAKKLAEPAAIRALLAELRR